MSSSIKELAGPVAEISDEEAEWAAIAVFRHVPEQDVCEVLGMLGLDGDRTERFYHAAYRRAVPDSFRRGQKNACTECGYKIGSRNHRTLCGGTP